MPQITGPSPVPGSGPVASDPIIDLFRMLEQIARDNPDETKKALEMGGKKGVEKVTLTVTAMQALGKLKGLAFGQIVEGFMSPGEQELQFQPRKLTLEERLAIYREEMGPRIVTTEQWRADP